jgi:hypothetical protein
MYISTQAQLRSKSTLELIIHSMFYTVSSQTLARLATNIYVPYVLVRHSIFVQKYFKV